MRTVLSIALACFAAGLAAAGENAPLVPPAEMQALSRAINREMNASRSDSQTLGDLMRLKNRLEQLQTPKAAAPADGDDSQRTQLDRLEREAAGGGRAARKALALYYLFLNEPEKALAQWRLMGKASDYDMAYFIISSYLELALGEYGAGRKNLETAIRFMDTRTSLSVSPPVFCQTVAGYRVYTARPLGNLKPGEDVLLYVEVEGAEFKPGPDGTTECRIMFGLKLKNDGQGTVWAEPNYGEYAPSFHGPIRDLHAALSWRVPNDLDPGRYHLTVEAIEDATKRRGEAVVGFNVEKRETSPQTRPTGANAGLSDPRLRRQIDEAQRAFSGGGAASPPDQPRLVDDDFLKQRQFEILQQNERRQRVQ